MAVTLFSSRILFADLQPGLFVHKKEFTEVFCPIQHGVSTKCGTELIVHHISLTLESNPNWIVLKSDVKNAFNSVSQDQIMEQFSLTFPDLYNHVIQMYGKPSSLVFMRGSSTVIIPSEEGVHQGDLLGPVLFATAIHPVLTKIQKSHSQVSVLAYLNEVFLLGGNPFWLCFMT